MFCARVVREDLRRLDAGGRGAVREEEVVEVEVEAEGGGGAGSAGGSVAATLSFGVEAEEVALEDWAGL